MTPPFEENAVFCRESERLLANMGEGIPYAPYFEKYFPSRMR